MVSAQCRARDQWSLRVPPGGPVEPDSGAGPVHPGPLGQHVRQRVHQDVQAGAVEGRGQDLDPLQEDGRRGG